ncbi:MAG: DeoR family transcriptional regulator [Minisyncoccota bacterium]
MSLITSEFLKHKAREISYALNRVSFYIKREELKNRLERLSFEFLENVAVSAEDASDRQSLIKVFKNISALDVLVRIGHSLYEIETVNSNILVRELDSFNSAIRQLAETNSAMGSLSAMPAHAGQAGSSEFGKANSANPFTKQELNLESIFSMPPAVIKESVNSSVMQNASIGVKKDLGRNGVVASSVAMNERLPVQQDPKRSIKEVGASTIGKDFANIDNEKEIVERAYSSSNEKAASLKAGELRSEIYERENSTINKPMGVDSGNLKNKVNNSFSSSQTIIRKFQNGINQQVRDESGNRTIRQNLISEKIRQSGKANVKELISQFPGVSERTLRYDLQRLCDQGIVEKIGSSGPGTSYTSKLPNP